MNEMLGYDDLRDFIVQAERLGAVRRVDGADPRLEVGAITDLAAVPIANQIRTYW